MNRNEAREVLAAYLDPLRRRSYQELLALMGEVHVSEVAGPSGVQYQIEMKVIWDSPREKTAIRVLGAIDDGRLPGSLVPVGDSFLVLQDGTLR